MVSILQLYYCVFILSLCKDYVNGLDNVTSESNVVETRYETNEERHVQLNDSIGDENHENSTVQIDQTSSSDNNITLVCSDNDIVFLNKCLTCAEEFRPNHDKTECEQIPKRLPKWYYPQCLISLSFSFIGITLTLVTTIIFVKHRETPVAKASTRELCYIMLFGMTIAHGIPLVILWNPSLLICSVVKTVPTLSFTIIYSALLVKTNRITRILAFSRDKFPNPNPRFISLKAQLIITSTLIVIGLLVCIVSLYKEPPRPKMLIMDHSADTEIQCPRNLKLLNTHFPYTGLLMLMCVIYADKTRNLPGNFNQAKFIGFAMYGSFISWVAFAVFYYSDLLQRLVVTSLCTSVNSMVILVSIFFPKLYVILWVPERNTRVNFATCDGIRCMIGKESVARARAKNMRRQKP